MRRMMHAAILWVAVSSGLQAQESGLLLQDNTGGLSYSNVESTSAAPMIHSEYAGGSYGASGHVTPHPSETAGNCSTCSAQGAPEFMKYGSCRPHSILAQQMQFNPLGRDLWATFPQERAALVNHMMRHVDGNCGCSRHYSEPCAAGGGCCTAGGHGGCGHAGVNRYQLSSLYETPSAACSTGGCGLLHGRHGCGHHHSGIGLKAWHHSPLHSAPVGSPYCAPCASAAPGSPLQAR